MHSTSECHLRNTIKVSYDHSIGGTGMVGVKCACVCVCVGGWVDVLDIYKGREWENASLWQGKQEPPSVIRGLDRHTDAHTASADTVPSSVERSGGGKPAMGWDWGGGCGWWTVQCQFHASAHLCLFQLHAACSTLLPGSPPPTKLYPANTHTHTHTTPSPMTVPPHPTQPSSSLPTSLHIGWSVTAQWHCAGGDLSPNNNPQHIINHIGAASEKKKEKQSEHA